jgi:RimJ/RimL family protein N-acetyltransferase
VPCARPTPVSLVPVRITSLGFRTDVALRALEGAEITDRGDHLVVRTPGHPEFWWGNFLLLAQVPGPGEAGVWLARFAAEFPAARHVAFGVDTTADAALPEDLAAAGLAAEHAVVLTAARPNPPPHPSTGAEVRLLDSDADWRQSVELAIRCHDGDEPAFLERRAMARRRLTQAGAGAWFGAFADGRLQAQLGLFDVGDGYARYQHVETDPRARRRGLAGTLLWAAGRYGREVLGTSTFVIVADPADVAIRIYQACGFTPREAQLSFDRPPAAGPSG